MNMSRNTPALKKGKITTQHKGVQIVVGIAIVAAIFFILRVFVPVLIRAIGPYTRAIQVSIHTNATLHRNIAALETTLAGHQSDSAMIALLQEENTQLKALLGRSTEKKNILATVLTLPNRSIYDTFLIDAGSTAGVSVGQYVYTVTGVALGAISAVTDYTATVLLFSASGQETVGTANDSGVAVSLIGRGAGEYEVHIPRSVRFSIGEVISTQSIQPQILAKIEKIETDARDPFQRLLAKAPVTFSSLRWVTVQ